MSVHAFRQGLASLQRTDNVLIKGMVAAFFSVAPRDPVECECSYRPLEPPPPPSLRHDLQH